MAHLQHENSLSLYLLYAKIIEINSLYNRYFKGEG